MPTQRLATTTEFPVAVVTALVHVFRLTGLHPGAGEVRAAICPDARYASVAIAGAPRVERRFASLDQWRVVERELATLARGEALGASLVTHQLLCPGCHMATVTLSSTTSITATPGELVMALDARLALSTP